MKSSRQRPSMVGRLLAAGSIAGLVTVAVAPAQESPTARPVSRATLTLQDDATGPESGHVLLEIIPSQPGDPDETLRLQAVIVGPLQVKGSDDVFAFSMALLYPGAKLEYLPATLQKGELLERDGKSSLITGGVSPGNPTRVTIGASRLGAVPGVTVPAGRTPLFSVALRILEPGDAVLTWEEASFIDSNIKPVEGVSFVAATLHLKPTEI